MELSRRKFFLQGSLGMALGLLRPERAISQIAVLPAQLHTAYGHSYEEQYPDMLASYLVKRLNTLAAKWYGVRDKIASAKDAEARNRYVREKMTEMVGGLPQRTPLNPVVTKVLVRDGYRIENVRYESRPNFWVTAILYIPTTGKGPFPGILSPSGHYEDAGRASAYQLAHLNLVKNGFVVLSHDPIGQGERRLYWDTTTRTMIGSTIDEHSIFGQLMWLLGESETQYFAWDCVRSIDYLVSRPEVEPSKIGCTGHSGGGFQTILTMVFDPRLKCAACIEPGGYHFWPMEIPPNTNINPGDAEEDWFPGALEGIDICDLYQSFAPKPLLLAVETYANKQFEEGAKQIRAYYNHFQAEDKFSTVEATDAHYWTMKLRLAATDWFCRWFYGRPGPSQEGELTPEPIENLFCTPTGSVIDAGLGDTLHSIILKQQEKLPPQRPAPKTSTELTAYRENLRADLARLIRYEKIEQPFEARLLKTTPRMGFHIEKLEFMSEPDIYIPAWVFVPDHPAQDARPILYVGDTDTETVGYPESGWGGELCRLGHTVIAVDVRGMGQTKPLHHSYFDNGTWANLFDAEAALAYMSWYLNDSLLGMRVRDVIRGVDYAMSRPGVDGGRLAVIGCGMGALWALYAAVLDARIPSVIADGGLVSYKALVQSDRYKIGADVMILGVLKHFDIPQAAAAIADRRLVLISPIGPMKTAVPIAEVRLDYQFTQETYANAGAGNRFKIVERAPEIGPAQLYRGLLS